MWVYKIEAYGRLVPAFIPKPTMKKDARKKNVTCALCTELARDPIRHRDQICLVVPARLRGDIRDIHET